MKNRVSRTYCQYSGIFIGFGLVFAFLFGVRTYPFWQQSMSNGIALVMTLITAMFFSYMADQLLTRFSLRLIRSVAGTSSCSR